MKYRGSFEELAALLERIDVHGEWRDLPHSVKQLRCPDGAIMNFATTTGSVWMQGDGERADRLAADLEQAFAEEQSFRQPRLF